MSNIFFRDTNSNHVCDWSNRWYIHGHDQLEGSTHEVYNVRLICVNFNEKKKVIFSVQWVIILLLLGRDILLMIIWTTKVVHFVLYFFFLFIFFLKKSITIILLCYNIAAESCWYQNCHCFFPKLDFLSFHKDL